MVKKIKILLVEDDKKFAESLARILTNEGYEVLHAEKPQTAISYCKLQHFDAAVVDCMLPQMNGIDLSVKLKEITGNGIALYLMSGIYKDRNFSVAALKKTNAKSFLIKPFEMQALLTQLKDTFEEKKVEVPLPDQSIKSLFFQETFSSAQLLDSVARNSSATSVEAPLLISCLMSQRATGTLLLSYEKEFFPLYFKEGRLLLEMPPINAIQLRGYLSRKDYVIQEDLRVIPENVFTLKLLQEGNHISPHFTTLIEKDVAMQNLASLRQNQNLQVAFSADLPQKKLLELTPAEADDLLYEWVMTTPLIWFKAFYVKYMSFAIKKMSTNQSKTAFFPLVAANKHVVTAMMSGKTMTEIMSDSKVDDNTFFKLMHLMFVYREFYIGEKKQITNHAAQLERLKSLLSTIEHQDAYERIGLTSNATEQEIKKSYTDLSQNLHPDKLHEAPEELLKLSKQVYEKIQEAYNQIKSPEKREQYKRLQENQRKEKLSTSVRLLEQALNLMVRGDLKGAEPLLQEAENNSPHSPRLKLLQCWIAIKMKKQPAQQISRVLQTLSQDEKDTAAYHYVRGLLSVMTGEYEKALIGFNNALSKDGEFMPARREILNLPKPEKKNVSLFNSDLKDVVGMFFKKK